MIIPTVPVRLTCMIIPIVPGCSDSSRMLGTFVTAANLSTKSRGIRVSHVVRFDEKPPKSCGSNCYCTDGSLLSCIRRLGASHVIVDEVHTRSIQTDFLLTVLKVLIEQSIKDSTDLKVIIMSATFDIQKLEKYCHGVCTVALVRGGGRLHDVNTYFL